MACSTTVIIATVPVKTSRLVTYFFPEIATPLHAMRPLACRAWSTRGEEYSTELLSACKHRLT